MKKLINSVILLCGIFIVGGISTLTGTMILGGISGCAKKTVNTTAPTLSIKKVSADDLSTGTYTYINCTVDANGNRVMGNWVTLPCNCFWSSDCPLVFNPDCYYLLSQTPTPVASPQQTVTPTATPTQNPVSVIAVDVNANDPSNVIVDYRTNLNETLSNAVFTAPGVTQSAGTETGLFNFAFDQHKLEIGENYLILTGSNLKKAVTVTAYKNEISMPMMPGCGYSLMVYEVPFQDDVASGFLPMPVLVSINETYNVITYSISVVPGSKTVWVGNSRVGMTLQENPNMPSVFGFFTAEHYYSILDNKLFNQQMTFDNSPQLEDRQYFQSLISSNNDFIESSPLHTYSYAHITELALWDPSGLVFAVPSYWCIPIINMVMPE